MAVNASTSEDIQGIISFFSNSLWAMGLWKPFDKPAVKIFLYSAYAVTFLTIFSMMYTTFMVCGIYFITDYSDLTNRLYMSLTEAALLIKVLNFYVHNREWQRILSDIEEFQLHTPDDHKIVRLNARLFQTVLYVYFCVSNIAVHALCTAPLFSDKTVLAFSGWYPGLDWENNRRDFWIIFTYQYIGLIISCNLNLILDSYYCFVIHMLRTHLIIFGKRLSSIGVGTNAGIVRTNLIKQIQMHRRLNETFDLIQRNLQWAYFCQIMLSSIVICAITKELARVRISNAVLFQWLNPIFIDKRMIDHCIISDVYVGRHSILFLNHFHQFIIFAANILDVPVWPEDDVSVRSSFIQTLQL